MQARIEPSKETKNRSSLLQGFDLAGLVLNFKYTVIRIDTIFWFYRGFFSEPRETLVQ